MRKKSTVGPNGLNNWNCILWKNRRERYIVQAFSYGGNGNESFPSLLQKKFGGNESRYRQSAKNGNSLPPNRQKMAIRYREYDSFWFCGNEDFQLETKKKILKKMPGLGEAQGTLLP